MVHLPSLSCPSHRLTTRTSPCCFLMIPWSLTCVQTWMWTCWRCPWRRGPVGPGCCRAKVKGTPARQCRQSPAGPGRPAAGPRGMCCGCPPLGRSWYGPTLPCCWCCGLMGRRRVPAESERWGVKKGGRRRKKGGCGKLKTQEGVEV